MRKPIMILKIQRAPDGDGAHRLAERICERRLARRQRAAEVDPDFLEWLATARAFWRMRMSDPFDIPERDFLGDVIELREPRMTDHPKYPKEIRRAERKEILDWCIDRLKRARRPGHPLPERMSEPEKTEVRAAAAGMTASILSEHEVDVAFSGIHKSFPWLGMLTEKAWKQARGRALAGLPSGVGPLLILGPPGIGKSMWSRAVAEAMELPLVHLDVGATGGVHDLQGVARGWGNAERGRLISSLISHKKANPMVILDELDAGSKRAGSTRGSLPGLYSVLLGLIEPSTARAWVCPYLSVPVDLRHVSWVATSNSKDHIAQPLLDRMTVVTVPDLTRDQLLGFAAREAAMRFGEDFVETVVALIDESLQRGHRLSLRHVVKLLDNVQHAIERPILN